MYQEYIKKGFCQVDRLFIRSIPLAPLLLSLDVISPYALLHLPKSHRAPERIETLS